MARPREFDIDQVLDSATEAFWKHGFEATSVADLVEATGLQKGSLYQAFGDKRSLFLATLDRYMTRMGEVMRTTLATGTPAQAIRAWIEYTQQTLETSGDQKGCLACNTTVELAPHDEVVRAILQKHFALGVQSLTETLERGQREGSFRDDVPAERLAEYLMMIAAGSAAMSKGNFKTSRGFTDVIFDALTDRAAAAPRGGENHE